MRGMRGLFDRAKVGGGVKGLEKGPIYHQRAKLNRQTIASTTHIFMYALENQS